MFGEAMRLSLMAGYSRERLQPLQAMWDTASRHRDVIFVCLFYFELPDETREVFWRAQWSDSDSE